MTALLNDTASFENQMLSKTFGHKTNKLKGELRIWYYKGKSKVVPALFLTEHHAMKAYWGVEV
jgi:hypothetical protein